MDNWCDKEARFDAPFGYKWATQSEYLSEYYEHRELLANKKEWIRFGIGDWENYRWKYVRKVAFVFSDTFKSQRFVHSGMEVCDINHVKTIFGLMAESPLMEYDDTKGIVEGTIANSLHKVFTLVQIECQLTTKVLLVWCCCLRIFTMAISAMKMH